MAAFVNLPASWEGIKISEFQTLFLIIISGFAVGFAFDFYRSIRRWLSLGPKITFLGDVLFSVGALFILYTFFQKANSMDLRFYILWGSLLGLFLYLRFLSRTVTFLFLKVLDLIYEAIRFIVKLMIFPYRAIVLLMKPPYALLKWASLLGYRISESLLGFSIGRARHHIVQWWERHFPPRTNG